MVATYLCVRKYLGVKATRIPIIEYWGFSIASDMYLRMEPLEAQPRFWCHSDSPAVYTPLLMTYPHFCAILYIRYFPTSLLVTVQHVEIISSCYWRYDILSKWFSADSLAASGLLGRDVIKAFQRAQWKTVGTALTRANPPELVKLDLLNKDSIISVLDET